MSSLEAAAGIIELSELTEIFDGLPPVHQYSSEGFRRRRLAARFALVRRSLNDGQYLRSVRIWLRDLRRSLEQ